MQTDPTFVLVHGASHGGWCWKYVADRLRRRGCVVFTPTLTGLGEREHLIASATMDAQIQDVVGLIESEELDSVILVGHSFGGLTAIGVADRIPDRLRQVVFLDSLLVHRGRSVFDTLPGDVVETRRAESEIHLGVRCMRIPPPEAYGVTDPDDAAWLSRRLTPHPIALYEEKMQWLHPVGNGLPCTYISLCDPAYSTIDASRRYARSRSDWTWLELPSGHDAMIIAPALVAETLLALIR